MRRPRKFSAGCVSRCPRLVPQSLSRHVSDTCRYGPGTGLFVKEVTSSRWYLPSVRSQSGMRCGQRAPVGNASTRTCPSSQLHAGWRCVCLCVPPVGTSDARKQPDIRTCAPIRTNQVNTAPSTDRGHLGQCAVHCWTKRFTLGTVSRTPPFTHDTSRKRNLS